MNDLPETPLAAYKQIIDELVEASTSIDPSRLSETSWFKIPPEIDSNGLLAVFGAEQSEILENQYAEDRKHKIDANALLASFSPKQCAVMARLLTDARRSGIHDVLARLTWWMEVRSVGLTFEGTAMPVDLSGQGLHGDYIGRLSNWAWPSEQTIQ